MQSTPIPSDAARPLMRGVERAFVNSRFKRAFQRWEVATYKGLLASVRIHIADAPVLDAGCGAGFGLELVARVWGPPEVHGIDIDPKEVLLSAERAPYAVVVQGSLTSLPYESGYFGAVFVFGVLHHIAAWRQAVSELARVLCPGGVLCVNEHNTHSVSLLQRLGVEQQEGGKFTWGELISELGDCGLQVRASRTYGGFGFFVAEKRSGKEEERAIQEED